MNKNRGATLVEALVAFLILSIGLIPALSAVLVANNVANSIKNTLIAANLAQEGVEVVRAMRDSNWFSDLPFDTNLNDGTYRVEWDSLTLLPQNSNPPLKINSNGLYNYSSGTDTIFNRRITITKIDPAGCNCELKIFSEVTWLDRKVTKTIGVESHLFNWK